MEAISVFDIFKIGVGPSSSHTMGPWRAAQRFLARLREAGMLHRTVRVRTELFGSLAKTGMGHGTRLAVVLGLCGEDPVTCPTDSIAQRSRTIRESGTLRLGEEHDVAFSTDDDLVFHNDEVLPFHPNGIRFTAWLSPEGEGQGDAEQIVETYYSVGGGFVVQEGEEASARQCVLLPYRVNKARDIEEHCAREHLTIPQLVMRNERVWRDDADVRAGLLNIWRVMKECAFRGSHTEGTLPGGLNVKRRAAEMNRKLLGPEKYAETARDVGAWLRAIEKSTSEFRTILKWVSTFALAVNEENACFGRVVTAPTNGAAGVIPAVLLYYWCFCESTEQGVIDFMLTAGEIGSLFKKGATISAAMGGCQAEIGVSSAMAAAGLAQVLGGSVGQALMAAEIAMEHHLGMTCDPVGGLVQVPCIERNTMGATKAITAATIALDSDPSAAKITLDGVINTMWRTAQDMQSKYKETAEGGLAIQLSVIVSEC
ncbi:MAG: L-serine ammonia-lyase [Phycisphaerales bacterium]|jgi:L-serine dehydratase|nr:L-serine ammonia-lyase [Phycisphaerales bacterium]